MDYQGDNLTGKIQVDGNSYVKCVFTNAELVYSGGEPPAFVNCTFDRISITFDGPAGRTIDFMGALQRGGFEKIIEPTLDRIRGKK